MSETATPEAVQVRFSQIQADYSANPRGETETAILEDVAKDTAFLGSLSTGGLIQALEGYKDEKGRVHLTEGFRRYTAIGHLIEEGREFNGEVETDPLVPVVLLGDPAKSEEDLVRVRLRQWASNTTGKRWSSRATFRVIKELIGLPRFQGHGGQTALAKEMGMSRQAFQPYITVAGDEFYSNSILSEGTFDSVHRAYELIKAKKRVESAPAAPQLPAVPVPGDLPEIPAAPVVPPVSQGEQDDIERRIPAPPAQVPVPSSSPVPVADVQEPVRPPVLEMRATPAFINDVKEVWEAAKNLIGDATHVPACFPLQVLEVLLMRTAPNPVTRAAADVALIWADCNATTPEPDKVQGEETVQVPTEPQTPGELADSIIEAFTGPQGDDTPKSWQALDLNGNKMTYRTDENGRVKWPTSYIEAGTESNSAIIRYVVRADGLVLAGTDITCKSAKVDSPCTLTLDTPAFEPRTALVLQLEYLREKGADIFPSQSILDTLVLNLGQQIDSLCPPPFDPAPDPEPEGKEDKSATWTVANADGFPAVYTTNDEGVVINPSSIEVNFKGAKGYRLALRYAIFPDGQVSAGYSASNPRNVGGSTPLRFTRENLRPALLDALDAFKAKAYWGEPVAGEALFNAMLARIDELCPAASPSETPAPDPLPVDMDAPLPLDPEPDTTEEQEEGKFTTWTVNNADGFPAVYTANEEGVVINPSIIEVSNKRGFNLEISYAIFPDGHVKVGWLARDANYKGSSILMDMVRPDLRLGLIAAVSSFKAYRLWNDPDTVEELAVLMQQRIDELCPTKADSIPVDMDAPLPLDAEEWARFDLQGLPTGYYTTASREGEVANPSAIVTNSKNWVVAVSYALLPDNTAVSGHFVQHAGDHDADLHKPVLYNDPALPVREALLKELDTLLHSTTALPAQDKEEACAAILATIERIAPNSVAGKVESSTTPEPAQEATENAIPSPKSVFNERYQGLTLRVLTYAKEDGLHIGGYEVAYDFPKNSANDTDYASSLLPSPAEFSASYGFETEREAAWRAFDNLLEAANAALADGTLKCQRFVLEFVAGALRDKITSILGAAD